MNFLSLSRLFVAFTLALICSAAFSGTEIDKGRVWLASQVQADGAVAGESNSIAAIPQVRFEVALTLKQLGAASSSNDLAVPDGFQVTEFLARRLLFAREVQGQSTAALQPLADALLAERNALGGYGATAAFAANALDSAFALLALSALSTDQQAALDAIRSLKRADGGFGIGSAGNVYDTSYVLLAAKAWRDSGTADIAQSAANFLLANRQNGVFASPLENAVALWALSTHTGDAAVLQPLADALKASQMADGSWQHDPYVTALALRGLWAHETPPPAASNAEIAGVLVDDATGAPIADAQVRLDATIFATQSSGTGLFRLSGVPAGSYTLRIDRLGYASLAANVSVVSGQTLQLGTLRLKPQALGAILQGQIKNSSGQPIQGVLVAIGTLSVATDAQGNYRLDSVPPGDVTITVTRAGYQTISQPVKLGVGTLYSFSPTLYTTSQTPPAPSLKGTVVDAVTRAAIAGAKVTVGTAQATTDSKGTFALSNLTAGGFSITVTANGYRDLVGSGTLAAGVNDVGAIALDKAPATSTLSGTIRDAATGTPIAGATLSVSGTTITGASGTDGRYQLQGISALTFGLVVRATGYASSTLQVGLQQVGPATLDIKLAKVEDAGITFKSATASKSEYLPNDELEIEVDVVNATQNAVDLALSALITDAADNIVFEIKANARGLGENPPNQPLTFPAASEREVELKKFLNGAAAGNYVAVVQAVDASGRVVAEGRAPFAVRAAAILGGGIVTNPPIVQAGSQTPVAISAQLRNAGNEIVPAGPVELKIVLDQPNADADSATSSISVLSTEKQSVTGTGLATDGQGNVYFLSNQSGAYKLMKRDASGAATQVLNLSQAISSLNSVYNLASLADGTFVVSGYAYSQTDKVYRYTLWKVSAQGVLATKTLPQVASFNSITADATDNIYVAGTCTDVAGPCILQTSFGGATTVLARSGLNNPYGIERDGQGGYIVSNYADGMLSRVSAAGNISTFATGLKRPRGLVRAASGDYYVADANQAGLVKVTADGAVAVFATGIPDPYDVKIGPDGNFYVSSASSNEIYKVTSGGTVSLFARALANTPRGLALDAAGNLLIANESDNMLRKVDAQGNVAILATGLSTPRGVAVAQNGDILVAAYGSGSIEKVAADGTRSRLVGNLSGPYGIAIDTQGNAVVAESNGARISKFSSGGSKLAEIANTVNSPGRVRVWGNTAYVQNSGFVSVVDASGIRVVTKGLSPSAIAVRQDGVLVVHTGSTVYTVNADGTGTKIGTSSYSMTGLAIDASGTLWAVDNSNHKLLKQQSDGSFAQLGSTPEWLYDFGSDAAGNMYGAGASSLYRIDADGALVKIASVGTTVAGLGFGPAGTVLIANGSTLRSVNTATGVVTVIASDNIYGAGVLDNGRWVQVHATPAVAVLDANRNPLATHFRISAPQGVAIDGADIYFATGDTYLFKWAGDASYPVRLATGFNANYLIANGPGKILGAISSTLYNWDGTKVTTAAVPKSGASLQGLALGVDGRLQIADATDNSIVTADLSGKVLSVAGGAVGPRGLAFDETGKLHVASSASRTILRYDTSVAAMPVPVGSQLGSTPEFIAFDASKRIVASSGSYVYQIENGTAKIVLNRSGLRGVLPETTGLLSLDYNNSILLSGQDPQVAILAAGVNDPRGLSVVNGELVIANQSNGTVSRLKEGKFDVLMSGLSSPRATAPAADGTIVVVGGTSQLALRSAQGVTEIRDLSGLISSASFNAARFIDNARLMIGDNSGALTLVQMAAQQAQAVAPGTVVKTMSASIPDLMPAGALANVDFGAWLPANAGEYRLEITRAGVEGSAVNFLHVGAHARGVLTAPAEVAPGDTQVTASLKLNGADFTSLSRVEVPLIKPLAGIARPMGMVGDKQGNLYFSTSDALYKVSPEGATSTVVSGFSIRFGLGIDSQERLYFAATRSGGGYRLVSVDKDGKTTDVANLGATAPNGLAVGGNDRVYIGSGTTMLRFDPATGKLDTFATTGVVNPLGVAIDGKDNLYVQVNDSRSVNMIRPDGSSQVVFSAGNGVDEPSFEGDGYPTMTADCGENLYLTASGWTKVGQNGEEHVFVQVNPRTRSIKALFDGLQVDSSLSDIDFLAFDRFGSRILMWQDYTNKIWQLPVTCGAIGVEAHLTTKPGQTISGASMPAMASIPYADGRTEYVWSLRDVTAQGATITFDTLMKDLHLGEDRALLDEGYLLFNNSFATPVKLPLNIPAVHVANLVGVNVATDKAVYPADASAIVSTLLANPNNRAISGALTVEVVDAQGVLVGTITREDVAIPANGSMPVGGLFDVGRIVPGAYTVRAALSDATGVLAQSTAVFQVSGADIATAINAKVSADKQKYQPSETVRLTDRITNQTANLPLSDLRVITKIIGPAGGEVFSASESLPQLLAGGTKDYGYGIPLSMVGAGRYEARLTVMDIDGKALAQAAVTFEVAATADSGAGLSGTITALPKTVEAGQAVVIDFAATNAGNGALVDLPLSVAIIDPAAQKVLAEFPYMRTLMVGDTTRGSTSWKAVGEAGASYIAVLSASVGGKTLTLAQDNFTLTAVPIKLGIEQHAFNANRVLALVSCNDGENNTAGTDGKPPVCETQRAQTIDQALTALGVPHAIVTNEVAFRQGVRSGLYNTYWISGKEDKLHDGLTAEVREAVFGGDGLIIDGMHDQRNKLLDAAAGIAYRGKTGETGLQAEITGPDFAAQNLPTVGRAIKVDLAGGVSQATFAATQGAAIVTNNYGAARTVLFTFDLAGSLQAESRWQPVLESALRVVLPAQAATLTPGAPVAVATRITNQAKAVDANVKSVLPKDATVLDAAPAGTVDAKANTIDWNFALAEAQNRSLLLTLRAPSQAGDYLLTTQLATVKDGVTTPYGELITLPITVASFAQTANDVQQQLKALAFTKNADCKTRDNALGQVQAAAGYMSLTSTAGYEAAIGTLVEAASLISTLPADVRAIRLGVDHMLREAQWRWSSSQSAQ